MPHRMHAIGIVVGCLAVGGLFAQQPRPALPPVVFHVAISDQAITPATARFLDRVISEAEDAGAVCVVVELDTPGGHLNPTQDIVTRILASQVPIVVYVSPSGGHAASAGLFITLSSHVAAMAPGTRIGAAHPVQLSPFQPSPPPQRNRLRRKRKSVQRATKKLSTMSSRGLAVWPSCGDATQTGLNSPSPRAKYSSLRKLSSKTSWSWRRPTWEI